MIKKDITRIDECILSTTKDLSCRNRGKLDKLSETSGLTYKERKKERKKEGKKERKKERMKQTNKNNNQKYNK